MTAAPRAVRILLGVYAVAAALNVVASATHHTGLDHATKPLLMPLLAASVWVGAGVPGKRLGASGAPGRRLVVAGLLSATVGDVALMSSSTTMFLVGMAFFLGCHACYITAFVRGGAFERLRRRPAAAFAYGLVLLVGLALMWHGLGALAAPIAVYALALATMATTSSTYGAWIGTGGALFLLSDMLIAVDMAGVKVHGHNALVMITYVLGQGLIATGWLRRRTTSAVTEPSAEVATPATA